MAAYHADALALKGRVQLVGDGDGHGDAVGQLDKLRHGLDLVPFRLDQRHSHVYDLLQLRVLAGFVAAQGVQLLGQLVQLLLNLVTGRLGRLGQGALAAVGGLLLVGELERIRHGHGDCTVAHCCLDVRQHLPGDGIIGLDDQAVARGGLVVFAVHLDVIAFDVGHRVLDAADGADAVDVGVLAGGGNVRAGVDNHAAALAVGLRRAAGGVAGSRHGSAGSLVVTQRRDDPAILGDLGLARRIAEELAAAGAGPVGTVACLGAGSSLARRGSHTVPQRRDDHRLLRAANAALTGADTAFGAGGRLGHRPCAEVVSRRGNGLFLHGAANRADPAADAVLGAGGGHGHFPLAEAMGAGGVGHVVEGVGLLRKARIGGHGAKRLLRGHLVDGLVCELMLKAAVLRHAVLQEVPQHAQGLPLHGLGKARVRVGIQIQGREGDDHLRAALRTGIARALVLVGQPLQRFIDGGVHGFIAAVLIVGCQRLQRHGGHVHVADRFCVGAGAPAAVRILLAQNGLHQPGGVGGVIAAVERQQTHDEAVDIRVTGIGDLHDILVLQRCQQVFAAHVGGVLADGGKGQGNTLIVGDGGVMALGIAKNAVRAHILPHIGHNLIVVGLNVCIGQLHAGASLSQYRPFAEEIADDRGAHRALDIRLGAGIRLIEAGHFRTGHRGIRRVQRNIGVGKEQAQGVAVLEIGVVQRGLGQGLGAAL